MLFILTCYVSLLYNIPAHTGSRIHVYDNIWTRVVYNKESFMTLYHYMLCIATRIQSTETPVRHTESSEMWPGQMRRISPPMGCDRITCLPLWREPPDHKAQCWRVPTHCIPWRPATSTPSRSWCSGMVVETVNETMRVFQTNNNNIAYDKLKCSQKHRSIIFLLEYTFL